MGGSADLPFDFVGSLYTEALNSNSAVVNTSSGWPPECSQESGVAATKG